MDIYRAAKRHGKCPPIATSTSVKLLNISVLNIRAFTHFASVADHNIKYINRSDTYSNSYSIQQQPLCTQHAAHNLSTRRLSSRRKANRTIMQVNLAILYKCIFPSPFSNFAHITFNWGATGVFRYHIFILQRYPLTILAVLFNNQWQNQKSFSVDAS